MSDIEEADDGLDWIDKDDDYDDNFEEDSDFDPRPSVLDGVTAFVMDLYAWARSWFTKRVPS